MMWIIHVFENKEASKALSINFGLMFDRKGSRYSDLIIHH